MIIKDFLAPEAVRCIHVDSPLNKAAVLEIIGEVAEEVYGIDGRMTAEALGERELASSSGMGKGIALPHARLPQFDRILGIFLKLGAPTSFSDAHDQPVDLLFCILAPESDRINYLQSLGNVAHTLRMEQVRDDLRSATDPQVLHAILTCGSDPGP